MRSFLARRGPHVAAAAFGLGVFLAVGGGKIVPPGNVAWIPPGSDWGYQWVAWLYFRHAPWALPLGAIPGLFHPAGLTLANADGLPWFATLAKLLSPILPEPCQTLGVWLALCFVLAGWFGARLAACFTRSPVGVAAGGALFAVAPVLLNRLKHPALCAHFVLLWGILLVVDGGDGGRREQRAPLAAPILLPAFVLGIHPYLALMTLGLVAASLARHAWERRLGWKGLVVRVGGALVALVGVAALLGYFDLPADDVIGAGFGHYNAELFSLVNPQGSSRLLPDLRIRGGQPEGFGFLGLGVLALGASAAAVHVVAWRRKEAPPLPWRRGVPLVVVAAIFFVFALATNVSFLGRDVIDLSFLYRPFGRLAGSLRSSGRFVWVPVYVLTTAAAAIWLVRRPRLGPWVVLAAVAVQLADARGTFFAGRFRDPRPPPAASPTWELAAGAFLHLALYPPRCGDGSWVCCQGFTPPPRHEDMYLAARAERLGLTYNGFGAGRVARTRLRRYCADLQADVAAGRLDPATIYLVGKDREAEFRRANPAAPCGGLDGELACVSPLARGAFAERLSAPPAPPPSPGR
jgi:hypothetical protein